MKIKKLLTIFSCFVLVLVAGIALAACGETPATLESITVDHSQAKNTFVVGDTFSADIAVTARYSDKTTKTLADTDYTVVATKDAITVAKGQAFTEGGVYIVDVTYGEKFDNYSITVVAQTEVNSADAIKTALVAATGNPSKTAYLKLAGDLTLTERIAVNGVDMILDLNGHELKLTGEGQNGLFRFDNSTSKIFGGSLTSTVNQSNNKVLLNVNSGANVTLENIDNTTQAVEATRTPATSLGIGVFGGAKLTVKNSTITARDQVISTSNLGGGEGEEINIIGSTLKATDGAAVLLTSYADVNISGSTLEGKTAILAQLGDITVENSTLKSTATEAFEALSTFDQGTNSLDNAIIQLRANSYQDAAVEGEKLAISLSGNEYEFAEGRTEGKTIVSLYDLAKQDRTNEFDEIRAAVADLEGTAGNVVAYKVEDGAITTTYVTSQAELVEALKTGGIIVVDADITLTESVDIKCDNFVALELGNHTITDGITDSTKNYMFYIKTESGETPIVVNGENGGIVSATRNLFKVGEAEQDTNSPVLLILGGNYDGSSTIATVFRGYVAVLGGTFKNTHPEAQFGSKFLFNCENTAAQAEKAHIAVLGGTFYNFDPRAAKNDDVEAEQGANYVLPYDFVSVTETEQGSDKVYTVNNRVTKITNYIAESSALKEAIENAEDGEFFAVVGQLTIDEEIDVKKDITLYVVEGASITTTEASKIFTVSDGATLTIEGNGTFTGSNKIVRVGYRNTGAEDQKASTEGHLVIKGGTFTAENEVVLLSNGTVEVLGGEFTSSTEDGKFTLNVLDESISDENTITVKGGIFHKFNPADCAADGAHTNYVPAEGYTAVAGEENTWEVVADQHVSSLEELKAAIEKGGKIVLEDDITLDNYLTISKETYLDMNGKTLTVTNHNMFYVVTGTHTLTIDGNGIFKSTQNSDTDNPIFFIGAQNSTAGKVVIKNGTFSSTGPEIVYVMTGSAEILGGEYTAAKDETNQKFYSLNIFDDSKTNNSGKIVVKGGTFHGFNPADTKNDPGQPQTYVANGYTCTPDGTGDDAVYTVTKTTED